jgi:hypothetical protein
VTLQLAFLCLLPGMHAYAVRLTCRRCSTPFTSPRAIAISQSAKVTRTCICRLFGASLYVSHPHLPIL